MEGIYVGLSRWARWFDGQWGVSAMVSNVSVISNIAVVRQLVNVYCICLDTHVGILQLKLFEM